MVVQLTNSFTCCSYCGLIAQMVVQFTNSFTRCSYCGLVAQMVEQWAGKLKVMGSNFTRATSELFFFHSRQDLSVLQIMIIYLRDVPLHHIYCHDHYVLASSMLHQRSTMLYGVDHLEYLFHFLQFPFLLPCLHFQLGFECLKINTMK